MAFRFEDLLENLGKASTQGVLDTLALWREGYITREMFIEISVDILGLAIRQGSYQGQLTYAEMAALFTDTVPDYANVIEVDKIAGQPRGQVSDALHTVLDGEPEKIGMRLTRLARSVTMTSAQEAYQDSLQADTRVSGWTRGLDMDACELCQHWERNGRVWPQDHPMPTHTNCKCQQVPVYGGPEPKTSRYLQDKQHREFMDSLSPAELEYYQWAKSVRDEFAKGLRLNQKYVDLDKLPAPPAGVVAMIPPPNPKLTLRGIQ